MLSFSPPQEQHPSQTSLGPVDRLLLLHAAPHPLHLHPGLGLLGASAAPVPSQLRRPVRVFAGSPSSSSSAAGSGQLGRCRYSPSTLSCVLSSSYLTRLHSKSCLVSPSEREGRRSAPGAEGSAAAAAATAGRSTPGGPSASSSAPGSSGGRASQSQPSLQPPLAFQFHQHNHQHQHTHTHHFTPFLHPTATAPTLVRRSEHLRRT